MSNRHHRKRPCPDAAENNHSRTDTSISLSIAARPDKGTRVKTMPTSPADTGAAGCSSPFRAAGTDVTVRAAGGAGADRTSAQVEMINTRTAGQTVVEQLLLAAQAGDKDAQFQAGRCFELGKGVAKNLKKAHFWLHQAALNGHAEAQFQWGLFLEQQEKAQTARRAACRAESRDILKRVRQGKKKYYNIRTNWCNEPEVRKNYRYWYGQAASQGHAGAGTVWDCAGIWD